eukprot:TRINITY_DN63119_c0_g1_i1.p1 TRINITY_DN63119_c0_g1~~TRINITY_DN63119_c0_g1_i1.p1  ORF type:complete len:399 (+),score=121.64 TRINITY_DN63119_c0_g1_i1:137-1333(+)
MQNMRDPAEIEAEERAKREAVARKAAEREAIMEASWAGYMQYFKFAEVTYLAVLFFTQASADGSKVATPRPSAAITDPTVASVTISREALYEVVKEWLAYRFGAENLEIPEANANEAAERAGQAKTSQRWTLPEALAFTYQYQNIYLDEDEHAGFRQADAEGFKTHFDSFRGGAPLKPVDLWMFLKDLGFEFKTAPEQEFVVGLLKEVAKAKRGAASGELTYWALLHLLRKLVERNNEEPRSREHRLIVQSKMDLVECEGWFAIFGAAAGDEGEIRMSDIKGLFETIGMKWGVEGTAQLRDWLKEVDEDSNNMIDFGEFCCLVQKMWDTNFGGIKTHAAAAIDQASKEAGVHGLPMEKAQTWTELLSKATRKEFEEELQDPTSPTATKLISQFERVLQ